jgi:hypothetical protein
MTLETGFVDLLTSLKQLNEGLLALRKTVVFKPEEGESVLVDLFRDAADDLLGLHAEALGATQRWNGSPPPDLDQLRRSLTTCHLKFMDLSRRYNREPMSYRRLASLTDIGRKRGGEWKHWANEVKLELERCQQAIDSVDRALLACWQELAQEAGRRTITIQATSVGQVYEHGPDQ